MEGYSHRVSAAALRSRDLVKISGHGGTWRAEITPRGTNFLERLRKERENIARITAQAMNSPLEDGEPTQVEPKQEIAKPEQPPRPLSPTDQLIADLVAAGGVLHVPFRRSAEDPDFEQRIASARRFGKVPPGKLIRTRYVQGELEIRFDNAPAGSDIKERPVPVPERLSRPHPIVRRFREQTGHHEVSRASLGRASRILQAIVDAAEKRGYEVANVEESEDRYGRKSWTGANDGHLAVTIRGNRYSARIFEEKVPARERWEREARWRSVGAYSNRGPKSAYDADATGRLTISLERGYSREGRQVSWSDRKNWTLEEKLPEVLLELEVRAVEDDFRAEEIRRQEEERKRQWEIAVERAKELYVESEREKTLRAQVSAWLETKAAREYLQALKNEFGGSPEADEWIAWIRAHIECIDPLRSPPTMPEVPEPRPEDLKPFLGGLGPYGPSRR